MNSIVAAHSTGRATEHSYRPALQKLFNSLEPAVTALNEPRREKVGAPDFSISRGDIVIGHCEAKDLPVDLKAMTDANLAQKKRYIAGLQNLLYTNCLEWQWYRDGELKHEVRIAEFLMGVQPIPARFAALEALLREFIAQTAQTITSSRALAERMAGKTVLIRDVLANSLMEDRDGSSELMDQYNAFKKHLIHDISILDFADIYAETITYGMFAARLHDTSLDTFSRQEALELLPKSNPFLRNLFTYVAGPNLDPRISWMIDDLARVFRASNVTVLMEKYGKTTQRNDPFLHFYEDFLKAYNPEKRDLRGVWYTPEPVVNFVVRAVDEVLKTEFGLPDGLADTSKTTVQWDTGTARLTKKGKEFKSGERHIETKEVHRVQILDPATGTGTFLAEVVKQIAPRVRDTAPGMWPHYVEKDLIPRLHGFELLMASYAMCHLKLEMVLREFGYEPTAEPPRVSVYLTNSLEEGEAANYTLPFAKWLSNEVKEANKIKRDMPIMCVIGNPPYSGVSQNNGTWIKGLLSAYKKEPGGHAKLRERKHWLDDDYVKFIRMSESLIEKNGHGVLGLITNHGYLDNPTFRGMRWHLLSSFDKIYVYDLHGNSNRQERTPDGGPDQNVFDIQQGVAIIVAVRTNEQADTIRAQRKLAPVVAKNVWGKREQKYKWLWEATLRNQEEAFLPSAPSYSFVERSGKHKEAYANGIAITTLMPLYSVGAVIGRDHIVSAIDHDQLERNIDALQRLSEPEIRARFKLKQKDGQDWTVPTAKADAALVSRETLRRLNYRPFDIRYTHYTGNNRGLYARPLLRTMRHMQRGNYCLGFTRRIETPRSFSDVFVYQDLVQHHSLSSKEANSFAPLYIYPEPSELDQTRRINFEPKLYAKLRELATHPSRGEPDEVSVFDYIYGALYCPAYREVYAEFLKTDFPRIPWPASPDVFWDVSDKGGQLRRLHLMEPAAVGNTPYPFVGEGDGKVEKPEFRGGHVWINKDQRFEDAPEVSWGFFVGGYQPAQKWLKDRKGRTLDYEDVQHYQSMLKILAETDRIMKTIEMPLD
ncbi:MAG: DNA methyltransferase [Planctomyces sp.]|nr:DNA methyltransferase [Planctomyces sp.]